MERRNYIACGWGHTLLLDVENNVWVSGDNSKYQLGLPTRTRLSFVQLENLPAVIHVSAATNGHHSALLDEEGKVWVIGRNNFGQLGLTSNEADNTIKIPSAIPYLPQISDIACGYEHTILLDINGEIWGSGNNLRHQLGLIKKLAVPITQFTKIPTDEIGPVMSVSCGRDFTLLLDQYRQVWGAGNNVNGELGMESIVMSETFAKTAKNTNNVISLSCGDLHSIILDDEGKVWVAGKNESGQLGTGDNHTRRIFSNLDKIVPMRSISCGGYHSVFLDKEGVVWTTGDNHHGQLGQNHFKNLYTPRLIRGIPKMSQAIGGGFFTMLVDSNGAVWGVGCARHGELGQRLSLPFATTPEPLLNPAPTCKNNAPRFASTKRAM